MFPSGQISKSISPEDFAQLPQWLNLERKDQVKSPIKVHVTGKVPEWISGCLYRNGCGLYKIGQTTWQHMFDGFAVLQRWCIDKGEITYMCSILDSEDYKKSAKQNRIVGLNIGSNFPDPCENMFGRLFHTFVPKLPEQMDNTSVNVVQFGDRLLALTETPCINEISPVSLKVKDKVVVSEQLPIQLGTAHPHMLSDGTMIYFGTNINYMKAYNFITIPPPSLKESDSLLSGSRVVATVPSRWKMNISFTHSFGLTKNYFVHLEQPLTMYLPGFVSMNIKRTAVGDNLVAHDGETLDILLIERTGGKRTSIKYQAPCGFVFHIINCYEDSNHVVCDVCLYPEGCSAIKDSYLKDLVGYPDKPFRPDATVNFARYVLPLRVNGAQFNENLVTLPNTSAQAYLKQSDTPGVTVVSLVPETIPGSPIAELPRINYAYNSVKYRYFYSSSVFFEKNPKLSKFDLEKKTFVNFEVGKEHTPGEPVFLSRPGATTEDDGVVVCTIIANSRDVQSYLVILDAATFKEVARANLPRKLKMSLTFHGDFTDSFLDSN